jgi:hypothetical protein
MFLRLLPLVFLLLSANTYAYKFPTEIIEYIDNTKIVAFINENDIQKSLPWSPLEGTTPPLTMENALKAVQKYTTTDSSLTHAALQEIELKQIPKHEKQWHYLVKMKTQSDEKSQSHFLIVLMSGKVLPGLREPEVIK